MGKGISFTSTNGIITNVTVYNEEKSIDVSKAGSRYRVTYNERKFIGWKDPLCPKIMREYESFAKYALDKLARKGFKEGICTLTPVDFYDHSPSSVSWNKYYLRRGKIVAEKELWESSIIPKCWEVEATATKTATLSELKELLLEFELSEEEANLLAEFLGKSEEYVKRNIVKASDGKVLVEDATLAKVDDKFGIFIVRKFNSDQEEKIKKCCRKLAEYGINVVVIPNIEDVCLDNTIKLPTIVNGVEQEIVCPINPSAKLHLVATGKIDKETLSKFLQKEYNLSKDLIGRVIGYLENRMQLPFAGYDIHIVEVFQKG